jgi:hypothetical protein
MPVVVALEYPMKICAALRPFSTKVMAADLCRMA